MLTYKLDSSAPCCFGLERCWLARCLLPLSVDLPWGSTLFRSCTCRCCARCGFRCLCCLRRQRRKLQLRSLISSVDAALSFSAMLLCVSDEDVEVLWLLSH